MVEKVVVPPHMFACLDAEGENYLVEVDLPGVKKKDINLSMHDDIIHVQAEREDLAFHGHLHFPIKVNPKKGEAKFNNGLLRVEVPLKEKRSPPIKIEVK
ncbi:MAG: Hsp20/alpha crystallin family protein [Candidatus Bathyarchaeota archaeon]|nr:Hsp20/alpha crystallin family protein [Candidatus Bathyarchaeota archaeon]MDH5713434.1 Hsp20/alpha crystallin family protein [Candidatus Bathyarchaeota archaeon]